MSGAQPAAQKQSQQRSPVPKDFDEHMTWHTRRYLIISLTIIYALLLASGLIGFGITKDTRYLLFITPTVLVPFIKYLVPMDQKSYELKMAKINTNKELTELRLQVKMLKAELGKQHDNTITTSLAAKKQRQLPTK